MIIKCPKCAQELEAPDEAAGESAVCPNCQEEFSVPLPQTSAKGQLKVNVGPPAQKPRAPLPPLKMGKMVAVEAKPPEEPVDGKSGWLWASLLAVAAAVLVVVTKDPVWMAPVGLAPLALLFNINARLKHLERLAAEKED